MEFLPPPLVADFNALLQIIADPVKHQKQFEILKEHSEQAQKALDAARLAKQDAENKLKTVQERHDALNTKEMNINANFDKVAVREANVARSLKELAERTNANFKREQVNTDKERDLQKWASGLNTLKQQLDDREQNLNSRERKIILAEESLAKKHARFLELVGSN